MSEPKTYTTAIIAAVPTPTDPVHEVVTEDAHVTLQFLGESADLSPEAVDEIKGTLEMLASVVYPFQVPISGTAELGPDKAQVLIVQSELLTKIRETLGLAGAVSTAVANSKQFPNWIPHLTLDYDGEMPDVSAYEMVEIGSLELWLGDEEHAVYRLDQKTAPVTAAGLKSFDTGLHPRGADGRFIEKFGVIKYLTSMGWAYGKVDGINEDPGGSVVLTVTPSDLSGNPKGAESIVLSPKQVYRAPKAKAHLMTGGIGTKKVGGQGGSNPGGLYEIPKGPAGSAEHAETEKFYVKTPKSKSHGQNEALANAFYEEAGVPVPEVDLASDGQLYSKIIEGKQDMAQQLKNPEWADQVRRNFAVDAWLGNRDVFGMTYDNILTDENGVPWRIDNGGALLYRAMGGKKTDFDGSVTELDAFRQGKKAQIYGPGMTKAQELDGAERVLAISPAQIEEMVADHGLPKSLADTLKARRAYIANYYGLALPETKKPAEAEAPTTAPLVDTADIAENGSKTRNWFKSNLAQLALFAESGDVVELPDGTVARVGVDDNDNPMSIVGQQAQLLGWQTEFGGAASIYHRKRGGKQFPRPEHGQVVPGADLTDQSWKRGDVLLDNDGIPWKIKTWNRDTGAMLLQFASKDPVLFDTKGKDSGLLFKVERWDPPVPEVLDDSIATVPETAPVMTEQQGLDEINTLPEMPNTTAGDDGGIIKGNQPSWQSVANGTPADDELTSYKATDGGSYEPVVAPVQGKTGQAAVAEAQIKNDLDQPLPAGNGTAPAPKKTSAPGGAKVMIVGDGTEAATGDSVVSKKDGKTYVFVKPKGGYAVVTDPNAEDPNKQLLKLASTMTQPGKLPAGDLDAEVHKTATGEVPALGMMAVAKDGWAGEITLISPDGKFVFITDANGTRKRKSVGTVSITSAPVAVADVEVPKTAPGPLKAYGDGQKVLDGKKALGLATLDFDDLADLDAGDMVLVAYADGTWGLEPYTGQPLGALGKNANGKIATNNTIVVYEGTVSAEQFIQATAAKSHIRNYTVVWNGTLGLTNGTTGPNGGLIVWDPIDPNSYAFELNTEGQALSILSSATVDKHPAGQLPDPGQVLSFQASEANGFTPPLPLYGDEAKTLADWKGQLSEGSEISLDGQSWLTITSVYNDGSVLVSDSNGAQTEIGSYSAATFVLKAPQLTDGDAPSPAWTPEVIPATDVTDVPWIDSIATKKKIGDMVHGDVVTDGEGNVSIIDSVTDPHGLPDEVTLKSLGEDWGSPANPSYEFVYHGNLSENPVEIPIGTAAPHLYPGATIQLSPTDVPAQVVSYPHQLGGNNWHVAVMTDGDPDSLKMVTIGTWESGADVDQDVALPVMLGTFTAASDAGVDPMKLNALWAEANSTTSAGVLDKHVEMVEAGIPFGTAAYPIHWGEASGTFFRPGSQGGVEEWDPESGTWNAVGGGLLDKPKVWSGVPFEGTISDLIPEGYPQNLMLDSKGDLGTYKPKPGETIQVAKVKNIGGTDTVLISYPMGLSNEAYPLWSPKNGDGPQSSGTVLPAGWQDSGDFSDILTIHDPFAEPAPANQVTHQVGAQPPADLGTKLQSLGFTPSAGQTFWVMSVEHPTGTATVTLLKQPDGNYKKVGYDGTLHDKSWTPEELKDYTASEIGSASPVTHYTWTYDPAGDGDTPALVQGLPEGFQPFAPGDGQSVLKVTLANGKENVYLQKQPGAGWYEMGPDGTVNEHSDAVKSNHAVQMKLQGKGAQTAKYALLHPLPEGDKAPGKAVPTFTNKSGDWTPEPHQKVISLVAWDGDTDPWFFVQDEPGSLWMAAPNSDNAPTSIADSTMQGHYLATNPNYKLVFDGQTGQSAVDTPEKELADFQGHVPLPGTKVYQDMNTSGPGSNDFWAQKEPGGKFYFVKGNGEYSLGGLDQDSLDADDAMKQVWPVEGASTPEDETATPTFNGYTPPEGAKVVSIPATGSFYVQLEGPDGGWFKVASTGGLGGAQMDDEDMQGLISNSSHTATVVFPTGADQSTAGVFKGYQTEPGDIVFEITDASNITFNPTYVKQASTGEWHLLTEGGVLSEDSYSQATIDWALGEYQINELQGTVKGAGSVDTPESIGNPVYAGVAEDTDLTPGSHYFEGFTPSAAQTNKLGALNSLMKGESVYALSDADGPTSAIMVRNSQGQWSGVTDTGDLFAAPGGGAWKAHLTLANDDQAAEAYFKSVGYEIHKLQFGTPVAPPAPTPTGPAMKLSGWEQHGVPDPASFTHISDPSQGAGAKAGDFIYLVGPNNVGLMSQLAEDWDGTGNFKISKMMPTDNGVLGTGAGTNNETWIQMKGSAPFSWVDTNNHWISSQPAGTSPAAPVAAPSAPTSAAPAVPVGPSYPGAVKPSQEDINAWGGALTKDGHIPTAQMFVTGKGPMSGKIISVSKDKTKAVVLTNDGKKTTRLIEALKVDISANYSAYAAPVTAKDIPQGMPLAVDTIAEALQKTVADGKFRAVLSAHQGISHGEMVITKATAPSGKAFNRVHLTLTPDQRDQLVAMLSGQGEKGDWATSSKMSDAVAIGDQLPMRKSSTDNPDGTPRWKVDPSQVPPTHTVTAVADDPSTPGIKLVTMTDNNTGETIVSRFHPGKTLTTYSWDPNKPKKAAPGAFSLSATAKAAGWTIANDGGISAAKGGADNATLYHEPGSSVSKSAFAHSSSSWQTLRNVSADGVVIELVNPKGSSGHSVTGTTVISVPQGVDETAFGAAMSKLGIDYSPMTQDSAKGNVRGLLRTLLSLDTNDVDSTKGWSDEKLFTEAGKVMGLTDLGWQDVLVGVDESTGKTSFFWSDRARNALKAKASYNLVYRSASTGTAAQIVSTVKYGSANSVLKRTTGMLDGTSHVGNGASWSSDSGNHAGHGSYASAGVVSKLPSGNSQASYKSSGMMVYHRPEAVLGRIMDYRLAASDAFGMGKGQGANHLKEATTMSKVTDYFLGGGLPTEAVGFIAVQDASERTKAIEQLKKDGFAVINGRPVEDIIITKQQAANLSPDDLPPVTIPSNARPILDLPQAYDAAPAAAVTADAGEAA